MLHGSGNMGHNFMPLNCEIVKSCAYDTQDKACTHVVSGQQSLHAGGQHTLALYVKYAVHVGHVVVIVSLNACI